MDDDTDLVITLKQDRWARAIPNALPVLILLGIIGALIPLGVIGALRTDLHKLRKGVPASNIRPPQVHFSAFNIAVPLSYCHHGRSLQTMFKLRMVQVSVTLHGVEGDP